MESSIIDKEIDQILKDYKNQEAVEVPMSVLEPMDDTQISEEKSKWRFEQKEIPANLDPDAYSTYAQIVERYGFNYSSHQVVTPDGYELTVMHISHKKMAANAPVVFMQHGLISSAETFVMNAENSPAFLLANAGYDIWLGNNRGTIYSRSNTHLNPDKDGAKFFDYSFYELGLYDAPTQLDYVRKATG